MSILLKLDGLTTKFNKLYNVYGKVNIFIHPTLVAYSQLKFSKDIIGLTLLRQIIKFPLGLPFILGR